LLVARRVQQFLAGSKVNAQIYIDASTDTDENHLKSGPPMLSEETGYIEVPEGKPIPGDGTEDETGLGWRKRALVAEDAEATLRKRDEEWQQQTGLSEPRG